MSTTHEIQRYLNQQFFFQVPDNRGKINLIIPEAYPKDAGTYTLTIRTVHGEASSSCQVSVKGILPNETSDSEIASDLEPIKPSISLPLKDQTVGEGTNVHLNCVIVGQPEPEVNIRQYKRTMKIRTI